ncbi:MAG TPA: PAS domain-containing protein [Methanosarcina sp.]|jgi:PAS domain S-box-containing protein|nr:PAS domain-containing protein [Methanosarcina sp.]
MDEESGDYGTLNDNFQTAGSKNNVRGEALHAALEKEETLKTMINNSHIVLFLWKNEDKWPVEFVSENVAKFGYTAEDFTSGRIMYKDLIYPDDLKEVEEEFERKAQSEASAFSMEYRIITKAGDIRWINERTFIQRGSDGEATHFQGVVLDITRRKKGEEELEETLKIQKVLTTAVNNSPAVFFLWKNEKYWPAVFVSDNVVQFGYTVDDFLSQKIQYGKIIHPDDFNRVEEKLDRSIQKGEVSFNSEYRIFTKTGDMLWVNERTFIQRDMDGKVVCFQGIVLDITRRKKIEKELRKSLKTQKMLQSIINKSSAVAFLRKNVENFPANLENWPVYYISENVTQFGYSVEDFLSGKILYGNIIHREDIQAVVESLARSVREGYDSFEMEYRIITGDGSIRWVEDRTFIQRDYKGKVTRFQGIIIDVTGRKEAEKMLEIQKELGVSLSTTWSLQTMLTQILDACLKIEEIDAAGIYLKDELLDQINLVAHRGLSPEFVKSVSVYRADSPEARQIWTEKPVYRMDFFSDKMADLIRNEKITAVAVIPMKHRGEIIGSLNFASHTTDRIPQNVRSFLESVAFQVVNYIAPVRIVADFG